MVVLLESKWVDVEEWSLEEEFIGEWYGVKHFHFFINLQRNTKLGKTTRNGMTVVDIRYKVGNEKEAVYYMHDGKYNELSYTISYGERIEVLNWSKDILKSMYDTSIKQDMDNLVMTIELMILSRETKKYIWFEQHKKVMNNILKLYFSKAKLKEITLEIEEILLQASDEDITEIVLNKLE